MFLPNSLSCEHLVSSPYLTQPQLAHLSLMVDDRLVSLLEQASQGDKQALDLVLQDHLPALLAYIRRKIDPVIRDHESCADIVQSVCREVIEHQEDFEYRGRVAFRAWLFKTALNKLIDRKRYYMAEKRNARREIHITNFSCSSRIEAMYSVLFSPSQAASAKEDVERLEVAFNLLSEDHQKVIHCSRYLGMSQAEIAEKMDRTVPAVRTLLHRALGRLGLLMHRAEKGTELKAEPQKIKIDEETEEGA